MSFFVIFVIRIIGDLFQWSYNQKITFGKIYLSCLLSIRSRNKKTKRIAGDNPFRHGAGRQKGVVPYVRTYAIYAYTRGTVITSECPLSLFSPSSMMYAL